MKPPALRRGSLFDDLFRDFPLNLSIQPLHGDPLPAPDKIKVDVRENGKAVTIHAEIPGVPKDDIHVTVEGNTVTIEAEVKQYDADTEDEKVLHSERYYGSVRRSFSLPADVDSAQAKAKVDNGVLVLTLPKKSPDASKKIAID